jgi:xanthine dehydrogenase YagR molybdenum-binding subunit
MSDAAAPSRVDGRLKVTGGAKYAAEFEAQSGPVLHAVIVQSTIAAGRVMAIDTNAARRVTGVVEIMTPQNAPRLDLSRPAT